MSAMALKDTREISTGSSRSKPNPCANRKGSMTTMVFFSRGTARSLRVKRNFKSKFAILQEELKELDDLSTRTKTAADSVN
jgi:hypothetical protein